MKTQNNQQDWNAIMNNINQSLTKKKVKSTNSITLDKHEAKQIIFALSNLISTDNRISGEEKELQDVEDEWYMSIINKIEKKFGFKLSK